MIEEFFGRQNLGIQTGISVFKTPNICYFKPLSFQKIRVTGTGFTYHHKMISILFKSSSIRLRSKVIYYRNYRDSVNQMFFNIHLSLINLAFLTYDPNQNYDFLTKHFLHLLNKHALLKKKFIRANKATFINQDFHNHNIKNDNMNKTIKQ